MFIHQCLDVCDLVGVDDILGLSGPPSNHAGPGKSISWDVFDDVSKCAEFDRLRHDFACDVT